MYICKLCAQKPEEDNEQSCAVLGTELVLTTPARRLLIYYTLSDTSFHVTLNYSQILFRSFCVCWGDLFCFIFQTGFLCGTVLAVLKLTL